MPGRSLMDGSSEDEQPDDSDAGALATLRRALPIPLPAAAALSALSVMTCVALGAIIGVSIGHRRAQPSASWSTVQVPPYGVGIGGWLVLEDWFFSGATGRHVMSQDPVGQGMCLPPLLQRSEEPWPSEGVLVRRLEQEHGWKAAVQVFEAHRHTFIGDSDWRRMQSLGLSMVRIALPWFAFADALSPLDPSIYNATTRFVPDPYRSEEAAFVTVDRAWLAEVLLQAGRHGLKVLLDIHMMPGASSDGTYNGVWPLPPMFWTANATVGKAGVPLTEVGLWVAKAMVDWVEGLPHEELGVVGGITFMNEPAHMANINRKAGNPFTKSDDQVLAWVKQSSDLFRKSTLPQKGVKLYINLIETSVNNFAGVIPAWFAETFSEHERRNWAVLDIHWYSAWSGSICSGRAIAKNDRYLCDQPIEDVRAIFRGCVEEAAERLGRGTDGLKACSEFSLGTFEDAVLACDDDDILHMLLEEQVDVMQRHNIEGFFWTWRMPYGPVFERAWSLKYIAGLERLSPPFACGGPVPAGTLQA